MDVEINKMVDDQGCLFRGEMTSGIFLTLGDSLCHAIA